MAPKVNSCILCGGTDFQMKFADRRICNPSSESESNLCTNYINSWNYEVVRCNCCGFMFRQNPPLKGIESHSNSFIPLTTQDDGSAEKPLKPVLDREVVSSIGLEEIDEIVLYRAPPGTFLNV